jgi:hypothetical protein
VLDRCSFFRLNCLTHQRLLALPWRYLGKSSFDRSENMQVLAKWASFRDWTARHKLAIAIMLTPTFFVFFSVWILENLLGFCWVKRLEVCFQFFTGNWPGTEGVIAHTSSVFAGGVTFRFALVYTALAGLWKLWRDLVAWKAQPTIEDTVMKYSELLRDRDDSIESQVVGLIPADTAPDIREAIRKNIHAAFQQGAKVWADEFLPILVGQENAPRILEKLKRENVVP